ncbi:hypothetical protein [Micromonospora saelicesensis]|uniref:hypothetical protein n=1 Tax=Micromonospora saelicesensis TaxID=285676 RepID=UPI000DDBD9CA|nr:hypothetical protein [Micromonospora saelicesensis]
MRYEQAVFGGDAKSLDEAERDLTALDPDVALARGRLLHAWRIWPRATVIGMLPVSCWTRRPTAARTGLAGVSRRPAMS